MRKTLGSLSKDVAIYGAGDVAVTAAGYLLLPLYLKVLTEADYGALALILGVETFTKILFRFGLDGAFMREWQDCADDHARRTLTSTLLIFLILASGGLLLLAQLAMPWLAASLFGDAAGTYTVALRLVLLHTFLLTFTFVPFHLMRIEKAAVTFSAFTFGRSVTTLLLRILLVLQLGWGLTGMVVADLAVTVVLIPLLWPWYRRVLAPAFSMDVLRRALRFGLPRLPHGLAQQALDAGNRMLLSRFVPLNTLGVYQISGTIGQAIKLFLSAFETGWAPFYYATAKQTDAKAVFAKIATYGIAILLLLTAGLTAIAEDLVRMITLETPWSDEAYRQAAVVVPLIGFGLAWQGVYLLTSIGLNLTGQTQYYPLTTFAAAGVGLGSGVLLMPQYGVEGAAVSFMLAYVTMAVVGAWFAQRQYPMRYEHGRIIRLLVVAGASAAAGLWLPVDGPLIGVLARGTTVVAMFGIGLGATGFLRATERALITQMLTRVRGRHA